MPKLFTKKNNKIFFFAIIVIVVFSFVINTKFINKVLLAVDGEIENPAGWSWNNIFGWHSGGCNGSYYGEYEDFCGVGEPILDVNFDSQDFDFTADTIKDNSKNNFSGRTYYIDVANIRNRTGNSNFNQSLYFDGVSSSINFGINSKFDFSNRFQSFSISTWFKLDDDSGDYNVIFSNGIGTNGQYMCYVDNAGKIICYIAGNIFESADETILPQKWYNLTITYSGVEDSKLNMYLGSYQNNSISSDNLLKDKTISSYPSNVNSNLLIGSGIISANVRYFKGEIDDFRIFDVALTPEQALHNMSHNSNYSIEINDSNGDISGWVWNQGLGWICTGITCSPSTPPTGGFSASLSDTKLNWQGNMSQGIYPNMITGWAKVNNPDPNSSDPNYGWISFQGPVLAPTQRTYSKCASCVTRDREDGLVGYWKMDDGSEDRVADSSGFSRDGEIREYDPINWALSGCVLNNCFAPKDLNNFIEIPDIERISTNNFSFEVWVKMDEAMRGGGYILGFRGAEASNFVMLFNEGTINVRLLKIDIWADGEVILDKKWHHIVFTADRRGDAKIYIDGKLSSKSVQNISDLANQEINDDTLNIGGSQGLERLVGGFEKMENWKGKIDVVRMYSRALSDEDVAYNYKYVEKRTCSACFDIDEKKETQNICYECNTCSFADSLYQCNACYRCHQYGLVFDSNTASVRGYAWGGQDYGWLKFGPSLGSGIYRSYVSAKYGNIYSKGNIGSDYSVTPPTGSYNSSYLIQANGHLINWASESSVTNLVQGSVTTTIPNFNPAKPWLNYFGNPRGYIAPVYDYPQSSNDYGNVLGSIDYDKLVAKAIVDNHTFPMRSNGISDTCLGGNVYYNDENTILTSDGGLSLRFLNATNDIGRCSNASGLLIVNGDLTIEGNVLYESNFVSGSYKSLASAAWIIKGDLLIDKSVTDLAGTFIVLGRDDIDCGNNLKYPARGCGIIYTGEAEKQLKISGQVMAKNFQFQRTYKDAMKSPAELIIYDGRNIINPPMGLGDLMKSLPRWDQIAPY